MIQSPFSMKHLLIMLALGGSAAAATAGPTSFSEAVTQGKISVNARLRYEGVSQTGLRSADALTLRTRLGYATARYQGWGLLVEGENIVAADGNAYSQAGINAGGTGRAVVADPETTELNQLQISFSHGQTIATVGRQRLVLDNARFVGDVGWRQNMQTFDALVVQNKSLPRTTLTYGYLNRIHRVFTRRHPQGRWDSESHVVNVSHAAFPGATITGYAYLLDFDNAAANACATYGAILAGTWPQTGSAKLSYRAEAATQSDFGSSPLDYRANYAAFEVGGVFQPGSLVLGREVLGSDRNVGFKTPLATLHAFNGWADVFLATPSAGLRDTYLKATANLPQGFGFLAFYHQFETAAGSRDLGHEWDFQLTRKFGQSFNALVKYAEFRPDSAGYSRVRKIWAQVEFNY